jgi:NAD(P)H-dependent flavin oxidoreductase YrpB (nitropropane dioxygenase family)
LRNALTDGAEPPAGPVAKIRVGEEWISVPAFSSMLPITSTEGRTELMANYAGQGVGLIDTVLGAAQIVERMVSEAEETMRALPMVLKQTSYR